MTTKPDLSEVIQLGDPVEHRGGAIAPLFPRQQPVTDYLTLEDALPLGFRVDEVGRGRPRARARGGQSARLERPPL